MRRLRMFLVSSLLFTAIPRQAEAGVGAKSVQGLFSRDECEAIPELLGQWTAPGVNYSIQQGHHKNYRMIDRDADSRTGNKLVLKICVAHKTLVGSALSKGDTRARYELILVTECHDLRSKRFRE